MSRALRITHWPHPGLPTLIGLMESDMKVSAEEAVEGALKAGHGFFTYDIIEIPDGASFEEAVAEAALRAQKGEDDERNMAIAYTYYVKSLKILKPDGTMMSTEVPPLSREQIAWVLRCVAHSPEYQGQRFEIPLNDGKNIEMQNGEVLPV